jgi:dienelactone hydrolase
MTIKFVFTLAALSFSFSVLAQTSIDLPPVGHSEGNHRLDCTVVRPWEEGATPEEGSFAVVAWANGWGQGNVHGADSTEHYLSGLQFWSEDGNYLVIAANQWSARSPDVLQCIQWLIDANHDSESEYFGLVDTAHIGVAGHSQGGGAALKAGDGLFMDGDGYTMVTTVVAMNPYGPSWVKAKAQNDQIMVLGGVFDVVTPTDSFSEILDDVILSGDPGGVQAEHIEGTHCKYACNDNFGEFGMVSLLWFQIMLTDGIPADECEDLTDFLDDGNWNTDFGPGFVCD